MVDLLQLLKIFFQRWAPPYAIIKGVIFNALSSLAI